MPKIKQIKSHQELIFLIVAVIILVIFIVSIFLVFSFLISRLNLVFNPNVIQPAAVVQFDFEGFKKLNLTGT